MVQPVRFVAIGEIVASHGLRGELRVVPLTDFPKRFATTESVLLGAAGREPEGEPVRVERASLHGRFVLVKLAGVETMEAAEALRHRLLFVPREEVAPLPKGRFYVFDLIGLSVVTEEGTPLGELTDVVENPANDLFVVRRGGGQRDLLIPALKSVVREVDQEGGRMVVRLLPGLLEASEAER